MENHVFLAPAVAGIMQAGFVEARHHTDTQNILTAEQFAENRRLQKQWAETMANPYFVVVDPKTGKKLGEHSLSGGPGEWEGEWIAFLQSMLAAAGRN
ncbi:MAG: hypothetical protein R3F29_11085 [Planctomycetota bacterium]